MKLKRVIEGRTVIYLIIIQLFLYNTVTHCTQEFEQQPSDITVTRGSPVSFPCKVKNLKGTLQWTMDGFGLGTDRELKAFPRFMMIGSNETGNYTLHITAALLADEAEYQCQVGGTDNEAPLRSTKAKLTVVYPPKDDPDQVYISPESPLQTVAGSTVRITCRGGLTKPVSKITWKKGNDTIESGITESVESLPNSMLESITSWVDIKSDKTYHKEQISCIVSHEALEQPIVRSLTMFVQYSPAVTIAKHFIKAKEGDDIKFTCTATGNPPNLRFRWEVNDVAVVGDHESEFTFKGITRQDNNAKVACIVSNSVGNGRAEETVNVEYKPVFSEEPKDVDEDDGKDVTLKCVVDSNPPSEIVWTHENSQKVLGHGAEWTFKVDKTTKGVYRCRAAAPGFSEISRTMEVFLRAPPEVLPDQISYGLEGDNVQIECLVESIPRPTEVEWSRHGVKFNPKSSNKYDIEEVSTARGVRNVLTIYEVPGSAFGWYNCTAKNSYGVDTKGIELRKKQSLPLVTTLVSIVGGIIFLFIVALIILLFKRQGKHYKDKDLEKQTSTSTEDSVLKTESRTMTGSDLSPSEDDADLSHDEEWDDISGSRSAPRGQRNTYRFSGDFSDPVFPPKTPNINGTGYIPYVDYTTDYNPPMPPPPINYNRNSLYSAVPLNNVDPRYSAAYGNPYLRIPSNAKSAQNIYGSDNMLPVSAQANNINLASHPTPRGGFQNNNIVNPNIKNALYQNRNNLANSKINSQYVVLPQMEGQVQGTHI